MQRDKWQAKNWEYSTQRIRDLLRNASGSLYELNTLIASNKKSLHLYEAILFNQINVIDTEWYYRISRSSGDAISVKM